MLECVCEEYGYIVNHMIKANMIKCVLCGMWIGDRIGVEQRRHVSGTQGE